MFYTSIPTLALIGPQNEHLKGKKQPFENFYCLFMERSKLIAQKLKSPGMIKGFSIDRMTIQVPANRHDENVPKKFIEEMSQIMTDRRNKLLHSY